MFLFLICNSSLEPEFLHSVFSLTWQLTIANLTRSGVLLIPDLDRSPGTGISFHDLLVAILTMSTSNRHSTPSTVSENDFDTAHQTSSMSVNPAMHGQATTRQAAVTLPPGIRQIHNLTFDKWDWITVGTSRCEVCNKRATAGSFRCKLCGFTVCIECLRIDTQRKQHECGDVLPTGGQTLSGGNTLEQPQSGSFGASARTFARQQPSRPPKKPRKSAKVVKTSAAVAEEETLDFAEQPSSLTVAGSGAAAILAMGIALGQDSKEGLQGTGSKRSFGEIA
jgi:hypothetical protein